MCMWLCYHDNSKLRAHQTGSVGKGSDHLQVIKFWPTPGRGSAAVQKFLAAPYYSQRAVFASPLSALLIYFWFFLWTSTSLCLLFYNCDIRELFDVL